jgi:phospholipid/cholesterol/gamma-HCH transport system substrate-binding protein
MADQRLEILAGAAVIAVALGFALFAGRDSGLSAQAGTYPLKASFRSVEGVSVGADVKMAGVKIGTITGLALNPTSYMADATIAVDKAIQLPTDSAILISQDGLLGGNYVEIVPGGMPDVLAPGDEIEDTQGAVSLINLLMKFVGGGSSGSGSKPAATDGTPAPAPASGGTTGP